MSSRLENLARRKRALIAQCARERNELAGFYRRVRLPLNLGAALMSLGNLLKAHPLVVAGLSGLLMSGSGGKLLGSARELLTLWKLLYPLWSWWSKRRARARVI